MSFYPYAVFTFIEDSLVIHWCIVYVTIIIMITQLFNIWCLYCRILNTTLFESWEIVGPYPSWWVFNLLLLVLQSLHLFWSYLIIKITCKAISKGKVRFVLSIPIVIAIRLWTWSTVWECSWALITLPSKTQCNSQ